MFDHKIIYSNLKAKQKENYNFAKVGACLAEYGYTCLWLNDDTEGADFLAVNIDGHILKIQLKSRMTIDKKYIGKDLYIAFPEKENWFIYPHDLLLKIVNTKGLCNTKKFHESGKWTWPYSPKHLLKSIEDYKISPFSK